MRISKERVAQEMADSLMEQATIFHVDLAGLTIDNFNSFLDDAFNDGGEVRCIKFTDLAMEYSQYFGEIESDPFDTAQWNAITRAVEIIQQRIEKEVGNG